MTTEPKTMDYGTLRASSDSWLLIREHTWLLHILLTFGVTLDQNPISTGPAFLVSAPITGQLAWRRGDGTQGFM